MIEKLFNQGNYAATKQLLDASIVRHEAFASNLSNIETPGYKRLDLPPDFQKDLVTRMNSGAKGPAPILIEDSLSPAKDRRTDRGLSAGQTARTLVTVSISRRVRPSKSPP